MPYDALVEREIAVPRERVFAALVDFGGVKNLLPDAVETCECIGDGVGAERTIVLAGGGRVVERLEVVHEGSVYAYTILDTDALPVEQYFACVTLHDTPRGTHVAWGSNWKPRGAEEDSVRDTIEGLYNALIDGLARLSA